MGKSQLNVDISYIYFLSFQPLAGFSDGVKNFDLSSLKKTKTVVTNPDGTRFVEEKDGGGKLQSKLSSDTSYGFVVDETLDLQVGEVLDGLIIGMYH